MKTYTTIVQTREEMYICLPEELNIPVGTKYTISVNDDNSILLSPFVDVEVDIPDDVFLRLAEEAHKQDITFNEHVCNILHAKLNELQED